MAEGLDVVFFAAGGHHFALEAAKVLALRPADPADIARQPAIERLLGLGEPDGERRLLVLHGGTVSVPANVTLGTLPAAAIHPLPPLVRQRIGLPAVKALAMEGERMTILVDLTG